MKNKELKMKNKILKLANRLILSSPNQLIIKSSHRPILSSPNQLIIKSSNWLIGTLTYLLICLSSTAQTRYHNTWVTGLGTRINFKYNTPIYTGVGSFGAYFNLGNSCICDSNGNLILVSNGRQIFDSVGNTIDNSGILCSTNYSLAYPDGQRCAQSSIILPMDSGIYYHFNTNVTDSVYDAFWGGVVKAPFNQLLYSVIDMRLNGGLGRVTKRAIPLIHNKELNKCNMQACRHANGKDWWLLKMAGDSNNIYTFLVTQDSIYDKGITRLPFPFRGYFFDYVGQMMFNQQGTQYASTNTNSDSGEVYFADFDRCYGILSNPTVKKIPPTMSNGIPAIYGGDTLFYQNGGMCFSPNGRFVYISRAYHILQLDLQDPNLTTALYRVCDMDTVFSWMSPYTVLYLGADNRIYVGYSDGTNKAISRINNPDAKGAACNWCPRCLQVGYYVGSPPNMPNYSLGAQQCYPLSNTPLLPTTTAGISVYPNPAQSSITIDYALQPQQQAQVILYNSIGIPVLQLTLNPAAGRLVTDISQLPRGIYLYRYILNGKATQTGKIILE